MYFLVSKNYPNNSMHLSHLFYLPRHIMLKFKFRPSKNYPNNSMLLSHLFYLPRHIMLKFKFRPSTLKPANYISKRRAHIPSFIWLTHRRVQPRAFAARGYGPTLYNRYMAGLSLTARGIIARVSRVLLACPVQLRRPKLRSCFGLNRRFG